MAVLCSFKAIVGSPCSHDRRDQSKSVNEVPLLSCVKDIEFKSHVALVFYRGNWRARTHSSTRATIFTTQQDISNLTICPFHRYGLGLVENTAENMQGKKQFAKFRMLQIEEDNALIKSKLEHTPRAKSGHLNFLRLDRSNSRPLGPKWCSNALPYRYILSVKCPS